MPFRTAPARTLLNRRASIFAAAIAMGLGAYARPHFRRQVWLAADGILRTNQVCR